MGPAEGEVDGVTVTRVGTQVVVRLSGEVDDSRSERLRSAMDEVDQLVLSRVVVDLSETTRVSGAGLTFLRAASQRYQLRLLDPPPGITAAALRS